MSPPLRLAIGVPVIFALGAAIWQAGRVAYADWLTREATPESVQRAIAIAPENALAHVTLALLSPSDPDAARAHFEQALRHNPRNARSLVELGLLAENAGDYPRAETLLLQAARVDVLFFPRWSLANYYLRKGDQPNFWKWARSAAGMSFGSLNSLYRLAAHAAGNDSIVSLLDLRDPATLKDYLEYAASNGRVHEVKDVIRKLDPVNDFGTILRGCDILIRAGRFAEAADICASSGDLRGPPAEGGFEWRFPRVDGVQTTFLPDSSLRIRLYPQRPERCELLWRFIPLSGPGSFTVSANLYTKGLPPESGLRWELFDPVTGAMAGTQQDWLSTPDWTTVTAMVSVSQSTKGLRLALVYQRAAGTVRTDGDLYLRDVRISQGTP